MEGKVKCFTSFGAFIDLGGFDGLLHINDMSWGHINVPKELVSLGRRSKVKVIRLDPVEKKINLSLKHFTEDPWTHFEEKYHSRRRGATARVTKLTDFGAFIEIEAGHRGAGSHFRAVLGQANQTSQGIAQGRGHRRDARSWPTISSRASSPWA